MTYALSEDQYGCEIVVRPDTIVYLALKIATIYLNDRVALLNLLTPVCAEISQWDDGRIIQPLLPQMCLAVDNVLLPKLSEQSPMLMQPIWKTQGKTQILADNCFDLFVWSDFALTRLFVDSTKRAVSFGITRSARTVVWLTKMLYEFALSGKFDHRTIIDRLAYNTKNDKAFAMGGMRTNRYMASPELTKPRVPKEALIQIILGGGQLFLSPERRLDAAILNSQLFSEAPLDEGTLRAMQNEVED